MTRLYKEIYSRTVRALGSKAFLYIVIGVFILQALWIACSFRFPMIYDEGTHLGFIQIYSHTLSPYTTETPGNMTTQISLFHYLLSFIYRFMDFLGASQMTIIITLRLLNIAMVAVGILIYAKLMTYLRVRTIYINVGLLLFVLLPIVPFVAATINYDNMLFPAVAAYLYLCVKYIKEKNPSALSLMLLFAVGLLATLIKFVFLPMLAATLLVLLVIQFKRYKIKTIFDSTKKSFKEGRKSWVVGVFFGITLLTTCALYGVNLIKYHSVSPSCFKVQSVQQCMRNGVIARNETAKNTVNERIAMRPDDFISKIWIDQMVGNTLWSGNSTSRGTIETKGPLPIMEMLLFFGTLGGLGLLIYEWKSMRRDFAWKFLVLTALFWVFVIFIVNVQTYYKLHEAFAIQPRYLLIILPILLVAVVYAASLATGGRKWVKLTCLFTILLLFTQGGGVITHIVDSEDSWYWSNDSVQRINTTVRDGLRPLVKE